MKCLLGHFIYATPPYRYVTVIINLREAPKLKDVVESFMIIVALPLHRFPGLINATGTCSGQCLVLELAFSNPPILPDLYAFYALCASFSFSSFR